MSGNISLCSFCRFIPLDVDTLGKLLHETRPRSRLRGSRPVPLDRVRMTELILEDRAVFALGKAERVLGSDCPFCKIVAIAVRDIERAMGWDELKADTPLSLTWSQYGPGPKGVFKVNDREDFYICFSEKSGAGPSTKKLSPSTACIIHPTRAFLEPSNITRWIANCKRLHGPECNAHDGIAGPIRDVYRGLKHIRFVDVKKNCIVERREAVKYVALSYVWGAAATLRLTTMNQWRLRDPGALSRSDVPATIWDAIELTRACGEQYLWVDALCIVQNDADDLEAGTYAMDLIYEMSVFTIVAASGPDAEHGLPGFRVGSRLAPPCVEVAPGVRLGILSEVDKLVGASCYATRGWTLQEEMLSKRILYFVDDRIFFHCPGDTLSEDCDVSLRWEPNGMLRMSEPFRDYKSLVIRYSSRALTTQSDAFRAVSGIIRRISETQNWHTIAGMPTMALENMMLFRQHRAPLSRRIGFPSYSWLGWKGPLGLLEGLHFLEGWINWHVRDPSTGKIIPVERRPSSPQSELQMTDITTSNNTATYRKPDFGLLPRAAIQMDQRFPSEGPAKLDHSPTSPLLFFSTLAVFFQLKYVDYIKGKAQVHVGYHPIGIVTLDGVDEYPVPSDAEFILLSKTVPSEYDLEELDFKTWLASKEVYTAMLIEWVDGVAERRGIGFISAVEIKNSMAPGPVWKEIILG